MCPLEPVDCVVFGGALVEQVVKIPRLPRPHQDNVPLSQMVSLPGGSGANVAVFLSRLGIATRLLDHWGNDPEGDLLEDCLQAEGVDTSCCKRYPDLLTSYMIILTLPDNDWTGITRILPAARIGARDFPDGFITSGKHLHFDGFSLSTKHSQDGVGWALDLANRSGVQVSVDACTPVALEAPDTFRALLPFCRVFFANTVEAQALTGKTDVCEAAMELLSGGARAVVIKAADEGCYFIETDQEQLRHCPAITTHVIDTIGAGDAVVAGVIAGLLKGLRMADAVRLGVAAATLTCQGTGAQSRRFDLQEAGDLAEIRWENLKAERIAGKI